MVPENRILTKQNIPNATNFLNINLVNKFLKAGKKTKNLCIGI